MEDTLKKSREERHQEVLEELMLLRGIIHAARWTLRIPADPACPVCKGSGIDGNLDNTEDRDCACLDPVNAARSRFEQEAARRQEGVARFERLHGHPIGAPCKFPPCPEPF